MKQTIKSISMLALAAMLSLSSCKKDMEETLVENNLNASTPTHQHRSATPTCGTSTVVNLIAGQNMQAGTVTVSNDATNLYVTYATTNSWKIKELHLYVGDCNQIPVNNSGNPIPGHFPYSSSFSGSGVTTYTFTIPVGSVPSCFCVAAHAVVSKGCGGTETAWGQGTRINNNGGGNWAMKFQACVQSCNEGCAFDPFIIFRDPNKTFHWVTPTVTVAGFTYNRTEGNDIYSAAASNGKDAFTYAAAIKKSDTNVSPTASVWADVAAVEAWLVQFGKLSPTNLPATPPSNVQVRINNMKTWITNHNCQ